MRNSSKVFTLFVTMFAIAALSLVLMPSRTAECADVNAIVQSKISAIEKIAQYPLVVQAVKDQNAKGMSIEEIVLIDNEWMAGGKTDFAKSLQENYAGMYLKNRVEHNKMLYTEAFLCDKNGAVVAEYPKTSDYWQGDEEKFINSFNNGYGQVFVGEPEYDDSTGANMVQVSVPVRDGGTTIGVLIMGVRYFGQ